MKLLTLFMLSALLLGCPETTPETSPVGECTIVGEKCHISNGQLGVCQYAEESTLVCQSQH